MKQKESASRWGVLAEEMGMGKIVQAIAFVLAKRALSRELDVFNLKSLVGNQGYMLPKALSTYNASSINTNLQ
ncbi:hypothetical protein L1987_13571 [Smallanthus sonchifolius]|uniref:Uncharacterized protein n=1 Tax=Smallanthus sonchifolius TaxID=185202 RepID=A0ACB9JJ86_9ASTR|nr:hypothetical protein L1987_13571 [Smallanthus sonchifolius]